jgi:hypothetical protein
MSTTFPSFQRPDPVLSLGIDVGLTHLSLCILQKPRLGVPSTTDLGEIQIVEWSNKNLLQDTCIYCGVLATYSLPNKRVSPRLSFCKRHAPEMTPKQLKIAGSKYKPKTIPHLVLCKRIYHVLDQFIGKFSKSIQMVNIELQPPKNKSMQRTSHYIFMALTRILENRNVNVIYVNAKTKLKHFLGPRTSEEFLMMKDYKGRKQLAIRDLEWYRVHATLEQKEKLTPDHADSFLYALYA